MLACVQDFAMPSPAAAASLSTLRRRAAETRRRLKATQQRLRRIKEQQARAGDQLSAAQRELELARQRLAKVNEHLAEIGKQLAATQLKLQATRALLEQHREAMRARILAQFRAGQPSFIEVMLHATDFEDFANRAYFARRLAAQDQEILLQLAEAKRRAEEYEALLQRKKQQQLELLAQRKQEEAEVRARAQRVQALVHKLRTDRVMAEQQLAAEQQEMKALARLMQRLTQPGSHYAYSGRWSGSFLKPVAGRITSPFGMRLHPILKKWRMHTGVDIAAPRGTPIRAAAKGRVIFTGWRNSWSGYTVIIDHGSGCQTVYCHIRPGGIKCHVGQIVQRGQKIAEVGSTGMSTGPHVHFGCLLHGRWVDPMKYRG